MAIAAVALGGALLYQSHRESKKARAAEEQARKTEQRRSAAEQARKSKKTLEEARVQRAQLLASGVQSGGGVGSSAVQGATGSVSTSAAETIGFSQQQVGYANAISNFQSTANRYASRAATFQALGSFAIGNASGAQKGAEALGIA